MRIWSLIFILITLSLNAYALQVILNPYQYINYDQIEVYDYNEKGCNCECSEDEEPPFKTYKEYFNR